ncbi:glycosyltransferase family 4 protein [Halobacterium wangiae]|uniref:glycosyltransferase family 4 protein n=1 Tax=Halobacterium wangiae TaxID=2902623 RepID=UPI001E284697|nr:glycosyltransferase family 4 protein [Halobacterium wangiae]
MDDDRKHVLFVTKSDLSGTGGHNIATKEVAIAFAKHPGIKTTVLCPEPSAEYPADVTESIDNLVHFPATNSKMDVLEHGLSSIRLYRTLRSVFDSVDPDLVVARMAPVFFAPAFVASRKDVPYVLLSRGRHYKTLRFNRVLSRLYRYNVRVADRVYTASEDIKQDTDRLRRPGQEEATVLPNAVDPDRLRPAPKMEARAEIDCDVAPSSFVVGFVGTMEPYHAIEELLRAVDQIDVDNLELLVVGDGPELANFRTLAENRGITDVVHFPGFVPHSEVYRYVSACDVMYGVSHQGSATPIKCFEYLSCERPILVHEVADLNFVSEQDVGRLVQSVVPEYIASGVEELAALSESDREEMGGRGREYVIQNHTWRGFVDDIVCGSFDEYSRT